MRSTISLILGVGLLTCAFPAFAAAPAAPSVTVGANDIKQLQFDWPAVPQANSYQLWFKANAGAQWTEYAETVAQRPLIRINVSVHLLDWRVARYLVKACNPSGCTSSAEKGVAGLALDAVGYFKPDLGRDTEFFGHTVAMSADGKVAATLALETVGSATYSVALYVYRKTTATSGWRFDARLAPPQPQFGTAQPREFNVLALNGDGSLIALGVPQEDAPGYTNSGAVYLFRRAQGGWHVEDEIRQAPRGSNLFGSAVDLDEAGQTLAIRHTQRGSDPGQGWTQIVRHDAAGGWQMGADIRVENGTGGLVNGCNTLALSGDGARLFRTCRFQNVSHVQVLAAPNWNETARIPVGDNSGIDADFGGTHFVVRNSCCSAYAYSFVNGAWVRDGSLLTFGPTEGHNEHNNVAISHDGNLIAGGDPADDTAGEGPVYPPYATAATATGTVVVYERKASGWSVRRLIKPAGANPQWFGFDVALGDNGRALMVGSPEDSSAASGINGDPNDSSAPIRGAAWLY
ncbi:MAG TPA: hypothetical protein VMF52_17640 [Steroidobacteraceae bacterium]|nr:hypothetical protein [Steroidobacteraceae bacterium]